MARHRRSYRRSRNQKVSWYPLAAFQEVSLPDKSGWHGFKIATLDTSGFIEHEATLERTRGSIMGVTNASNDVFQLVVTGQVLPMKFTELTDLPDPFDIDEGDDFFLS